MVTDRISVNNRVGGLNIVPEIRIKTVFIDAGAVRSTVKTAEAAALKGEFADIDHVTRAGNTFPESVYHVCKCGAGAVAREVSDDDDAF